MTKRETLDFVKELQYLCQEKGIWLKVEMENKPELKDVILTLSIKVKDS